jgi:long-chain fatty acid transport protein
VTQRKSLCAAAVALALASGSAFATNGYFAHGYGTKNKGMAGAGVALPQDAMTAATNPAGMAVVGDRLDIGAELFAPYRSYSASSPPAAPGAVPTSGDVDSDQNIFLIPHFAYNKMLDASTSIGVAVYGNGGMNTDYPASATGGFGTYGGGQAGVDLAQLFIAPTVAKKLNSKVSVGISAIIAYQRFEAYGLSGYAGVSNDSTNLTNNGYDDSVGLGGKIGILADVSSNVTVGASYQSRVYMKKFDKYAGLFAEQGDFDIPSNFTVGLAVKATPAVTLTADVQRIMYSEVDAIANPMMPNFGTCATRATPTDPSCLGGDNGIGFGWDDMTIVKLGAQYEYSPDLTLRAGFSHGEQPIPTSEVLFNILAPAVVENHFTLGATKKLSKNSEFSVAAMYAPEKKVSGAPFGQTIELKMHQFDLEASYGMTWN